MYISYYYFYFTFSKKKIEQMVNVCKFSDLADTSATREEHRVLDAQQLLQHVAEAHRVHGGHQHVKEWHLLVVFEGGHNALPRVHALHVKVHVAAPQVPNIGQLVGKELKYKTLLFCWRPI